MRDMTGVAALSLYGKVLKHERPLLFPVALVTNLVLLGAGAQLPGQRPAMRVVAVVALNQPLLNTVPVRASEFSSYLSVAAIAQERLLFDEQRPLRLGFVRRMATGAAHIVGQMGGPQKIGMLIVEGMAGQASFRGLFGREILEIDNLGDIAAALDVRFARTVTSLTALMLRRCFLVKGSREMSGVLEVLGQILVAGLAGIFAYVF
jgi:hypothetical protein